MFAHIDADAFFASVLQRQHPHLKGKPILAVGMGGGCVIAASYPAKQKGVYTGMRLQEAQKIVPEALAVPVDFAATCIASQQLFAVFEKYCPGGVEKASIDEAYLDMSYTIPTIDHSAHTALHQFANTIQSHADRYLDLPISIGIAPTKTLAKMASKKNKPHGVCILSDEQKMYSFLQDSPIGSIPGIGKKTIPKLKEIHVHTAYAFTRMNPAVVQQILGKRGYELQQEVSCQAIYSVSTERPLPKSISRCRSFRRTRNDAFLYAQLVTHVQRCIYKLRRKGMECHSVGVWIRMPEGYAKQWAERDCERYIAEEALLLPYVRDAWHEIQRSLQKRGTVNQIGIVLFDLKLAGARQVSLFEDVHTCTRSMELQQALDTVRSTFGRECVVYGGALGCKR